MSIISPIGFTAGVLADPIGFAAASIGFAAEA
jgi:hypothetical protein